jgi:hypothetical protein
MSDDAREGAVLAPCLDAMVVEIRNIERTCLVNCQAGRRVERARLRSRPAERETKLTRRRELLDPVLLVIGDIHGAVSTDGHAHGIPELAAALALTPPLPQEFTRRVEPNDSQPRIGHIDVSRGRNRNADRPVELSIRNLVAIPRRLQRVARAEGRRLQDGPASPPAAQHDGRSETD